MFEGGGRAVGRALGARSAPELEALSSALIANTPLPDLAGLARQSSLNDIPIASAAAATAAMAGPRSHGSSAATATPGRSA